MRQNSLNIVVFVVVAAAVLGGWYYVETTFFPPPPPKPTRETLLALTGAAAAETKPAAEYRMRPVPPEVLPPRESLLALAGGAVADTRPAATWPMRTRPDEAVKPRATPTEPPTFVQLGDGELNKGSYVKVILTTRGAAVQQVTLTRFEEANRLGREVKRPDGTAQPLRVIPGVERPRPEYVLTDLHNGIDVGDVPDLAPGTVADPKLRERLAEPSYLILHYPAKDDPARQPDDATQMNANHPSPELGDRNWKLVATDKVGDDWRAVFETELGAPYFLKLRKTYTLAPKEYHVGLKFDVEPLPGRAKGKGEFRYQIVGARGMPIEGEWYTYTYRNVMAGWKNQRGGAFRAFEDPVSIQAKHGGDRVVRAPGETFNYAAVATQYFASAVAIDDTQPADVREKMWEYVRATREPGPWDRPDQPFLADVTVRAVATPLDPAEQETISHRYMIYNGPVKVGLLNLLQDTGTVEKTVDPGLVERYLDNLTLRTLTDYHSPTVFGRFANAIWWSDIVIFFTNLMHGLLGLLHKVVPVWGLNIVMLTVCVRLMLLYPSRRQQMAMAKMQAKMAALKPEIDKIQEKYKDDFYAQQQAKSELMKRSGVNPASTMGGCLLLFLQMPVLMGLYYCLQESVFFRLESFLWWIPNLAAPDMLVWWTEHIPFVSSPSSLGSTFYLGPYLNILPIVSCALIFYQQHITLPPATDEQQEMQQKTMKMMVVFMAVFFYKVPAGLVLYFICGTLWALGERQLLPKPTVTSTPTPAPTTGTTSGTRPGAPAEPEKPQGWLARKVAEARERVEEIQRQAEQQSGRQIRNAPPPDRNRGGNDRRDKKKKRK